MIKFKKALFACLAVFVFAGMSALAQTSKAVTPAAGTIPLRHYLINLSYDVAAGLGQIKGITLVDGAANAGVEPTGGWRYDAVSAQGEVVDHRFIQVPVNCQSTNAANPKANQVCAESGQFDLTLGIPFNSQVKNINVYDPNGKMIAFVDVSEFSQACGDGNCDKGENYKTCPQDCRSGIKDGYCDGVADGVCDPDCAATKDPDCAKLAAIKTTPVVGQVSAFPFVILIIIVIIIGAVALVMFIKKKKGPANNGQSSEGQSQSGNPSQNNQ